MGWIGPHTGNFYHELSYVDGKSESFKTLEECLHDKPKSLEWKDDGNPIQALVANRRLCGEVQSRPIFCRRTVIVDHHEIFDSCLALAIA